MSCENNETAFKIPSRLRKREILGERLRALKRNTSLRTGAPIRVRAKAECTQG